MMSRSDLRDGDMLRESFGTSNLWKTVTSAEHVDAEAKK